MRCPTRSGKISLLPSQAWRPDLVPSRFFFIPVNETGYFAYRKPVPVTVDGMKIFVSRMDEQDPHVDQFYAALAQAARILIETDCIRA